MAPSGASIVWAAAVSTRGTGPGQAVLSLTFASAVFALYSLFVGPGEVVYLLASVAPLFLDFVQLNASNVPLIAYHPVHHSMFGCLYGVEPDCL